MTSQPTNNDQSVTYLEELLEEIECHEGVQVEGDDGAEALVLHVNHRLVDRNVWPDLPSKCDPNESTRCNAMRRNNIRQQGRWMGG